MKLGVMADSHDNVPMVRRAVELFNRRQVDLVIHAGDFVAPFAIAPLADLDCRVVAVFGNNAKQKKAALSLIRDMKSNTSLSGRHRQLRDMLKKGANIAEMIKATRSSRRTIFRYLNHFEDAGLEIVIEKGKYRLA